MRVSKPKFTERKDEVERHISRLILELEREYKLTVSEIKWRPRPWLADVGVEDVPVTICGIVTC